MYLISFNVSLRHQQMALLNNHWYLLQLEQLISIGFGFKWTIINIAGNSEINQNSKIIFYILPLVLPIDIKSSHGYIFYWHNLFDKWFERMVLKGWYWLRSSFSDVNLLTTRQWLDEVKVPKLLEAVMSVLSEERSLQCYNFTSL